jgi:hypothetical protein
MVLLVAELSYRWQRGQKNWNIYVWKVLRIDGEPMSFRIIWVIKNCIALKRFFIAVRLFLVLLLTLY